MQLQDNEQLGSVAGKRERMSSLLLMSAIIVGRRAIYSQGLFRQDLVVCVDYCKWLLNCFFLGNRQMGPANLYIICSSFLILTNGSLFNGYHYVFFILIGLFMELKNPIKSFVFRNKNYMTFITYQDLIKMPQIAEAFDNITYLIATFIVVLWHITLTVALCGDVVFDADTFRNRIQIFVIIKLRPSLFILQERRI